MFVPRGMADRDLVSGPLVPEEVNIAGAWEGVGAFHTNCLLRRRANLGIYFEWRRGIPEDCK